jgi:hypothetical protein
MTRVRTGFALGLVAALALSLGALSRGATVPSLYANYGPSCTFAFVTDSGATASNVPPGTYQIVVSTPFAFSNGQASCEFVEFHLTGPGVNLHTDLGSGDAEVEQHTVTLQPGGTYTAQDDGRPVQTRRTFTVATSGPAATTAAPAAPSSSPSVTATKGTASKDPVGSAVLPLRGTLEATVSTAGRVTLTRAKKAVLSLKAGRYTVRVVDGSPTAGFAVQVRKGTPKTVSTARFTGSRSVVVALPAGQWFFYAPGRDRHAFVVTR